MMAAAYRLLPFRFRRLAEITLLVGETGQFHAISHADLSRIVQGDLSPEEPLFLDLAAKDFVCREYTAEGIERYAVQYRTRKRFLFDSTALHMFVVTQRCNQRCRYCHASSENDSPDGSRRLDMTPEIGCRCVEVAFESPSPALKIEFQGGEPLLNFPVVKAIVDHAEKLNALAGKQLEFVICTNLLSISDEQLAYLKAHNVAVSTSLDGPETAHDAYRVMHSGAGTWRTVSANIKRAQAALGEDRVSALMTVTQKTLNSLETALDTYWQHGLTGIFVRMLNPFGRARDGWEDLAYSVEEYCVAYLHLLDRIIEVNKQGVFLVDELASILLGKILTPLAGGFVDLQSPAGTALSALVYEVDGGVFISDEARMLYKATGDARFRLGNALLVGRDALFTSENLRGAVAASIIETLPGCSWCAYQPYCGTDPVRNYTVFGDMISCKPYDSWCSMYQRICDALFAKILSGDEKVMDVFWSWVTRRSYAEVALNASYGSLS